LPSDLLEADGGANVIAHDGFASIEVAAKHRVDAVAQKGFGEFRVTLDLMLVQALSVPFARLLQRGPRLLRL
jgi:hypothetical protein